MPRENLALGVKRENGQIVIVGLDKDGQPFFDIIYTPAQALEFASLIISKINGD